VSIIEEALKKAMDGKTEEASAPKDLKGADSVINAVPAPKKKTVTPQQILMALGVVFIVIAVYLLSAPGKPAKAASKYSVVSVKDTRPPASKTDTKIALEPSFGRVQDMKGILMPKPKLPDLILNGIMQLVDGPRAIINNVIVGVGDIIESATVSRIDKNEVVLKTEESEITLKLR